MSTDYFQIRSHSKILKARTSKYIFRDIFQTIIDRQEYSRQKSKAIKLV